MRWLAILHPFGSPAPHRDNLKGLTMTTSTEATARPTKFTAARDAALGCVDENAHERICGLALLIWAGIEEPERRDECDRAAVDIFASLNRTYDLLLAAMTPQFRDVIVCARAREVLHDLPTVAGQVYSTWHDAAGHLLGEVLFRDQIGHEVCRPIEPCDQITTYVRPACSRKFELARIEHVLHRLGEACDQITVGVRQEWGLVMKSATADSEFLQDDGADATRCAEFVLDVGAMTLSSSKVSCDFNGSRQFDALVRLVKHPDVAIAGFDKQTITHLRTKLRKHGLEQIAGAIVPKGEGRYLLSTKEIGRVELKQPPQA